LFRSSLEAQEHVLKAIKTVGQRDSQLSCPEYIRTSGHPESGEGFVTPIRYIGSAGACPDCRHGHGRFLGRVHAINARRAKPAAKSLKGPHGTGHTLARSDAALAAYFNLQDRLAQILVVSNRDIPELKAPSLVGPQSGIDSE
jgi:hypothetical protein